MTMEEFRAGFKGSLCSTCIFLPSCNLTTDKYTISSCSEYKHELEGKKKISLFQRTQVSGPQKNKILNNCY